MFYIKIPAIGISAVGTIVGIVYVFVRLRKTAGVFIFCYFQVTFADTCQKLCTRLSPPPYAIHAPPMFLPQLIFINNCLLRCKYFSYVFRPTEAFRGENLKRNTFVIQNVVIEEHK